MTSEDREDIEIIKARLVALWAAREDARKARSMARRAMLSRLTMADHFEIERVIHESQVTT